MVPVGAEEVSQPRLIRPPAAAPGELHVLEATPRPTSPPIVEIGELHEEVADRDVAAGAATAAAGAGAVAAAGAAEARAAEEAVAATEAVAAADAASAAAALPAAGASGAPLELEEEPKKGMEPQPARPRARTATTAAVNTVERMISPDEKL